MKLSTVFTISTVYTVSSLLPSVAAHGFVKEINIAGTTYEGWRPFDDPYAKPTPDRVTRKIKSDGPVMDWNSPDITCNTGAPTTAGITADAQPGDDIEFLWQWVADHKGPIVTWLADCGDTCEGFSGTDGAVWFKIDEGGLITPPAGSGSGGFWASDKLMADGGKWTVKVPNGIKAGSYLMRHEIVAMHSAGAPQFYPSCTQLKIGGSGTKVASASEKAAIPGFYDQDKDSILMNIWGTFSSYKVAGPPVVSFASSGGSAPAPSDPSTGPSDPPSDPSTGPADPPRPSTTSITKTTTVTGRKPTGTRDAVKPATTSAQACQASKKRSTDAQSPPSREKSKRHIKRRLSFNHDH